LVDDAVQAIWVEISQALDRLRDAERSAAYINQIAFDVMASLHASPQARSFESADSIAAKPAGSLYSRETYISAESASEFTPSLTELHHDDLVEAMKSLTMIENFVVTQRLDGVRLSDIAASIGKSTGTAHNIYAEAVRKITQFIADLHGIQLVKRVDSSRPEPGQMFGYWRVLSDAGKNRHGDRAVLCECTYPGCGRRCEVTETKLVTGRSRQCAKGGHHSAGLRKI